MHIEANCRLARPVEEVWAALNSLEVLKACIPGCQSLARQEDGRIAAEVRIKLGLVETTFRGTLSQSEVRPPESVRLSGVGDGGSAGFANGSAELRLAADGDDGTRLAYIVDATVGGKLAQLGSRLIDAAAGQFADDFFARLRIHLAEPSGAAVPGTDEGTPPVRASLPALVWVPGLIALVLFLLFLFNLA